MLPTPQHGQFRWPQGGIEKGMCWVYAGGRMIVWDMGGVCAVGERDSGTGVCQCLWEPVSNSLSYWWRRNTERLPSSEQLHRAHNVGLCSPVAGGDRGASVKITLTVPIFFCFLDKFRLCDHCQCSQQRYFANQNNILYFKSPVKGHVEIFSRLSQNNTVTQMNLETGFSCCNHSSFLILAIKRSLLHPKSKNF